MIYHDESKQMHTTTKTQKQTQTKLELGLLRQILKLGFLPTVLKKTT